MGINQAYAVTLLIPSRLANVACMYRARGYGKEEDKFPLYAPIGAVKRINEISVEGPNLPGAD